MYFLDRARVRVVDTIRIIIKYLKFVQHVSDHKGSSLDCAVHTRTTGKYAAITPTKSMSTDTIEPLL